MPPSVNDGGMVTIKRGLQQLEAEVMRATGCQVGWGEHAWADLVVIDVVLRYTCAHTHTWMHTYADMLSFLKLNPVAPAGV